MEENKKMKQESVKGLETEKNKSKKTDTERNSEKNDTEKSNTEVNNETNKSSLNIQNEVVFDGENYKYTDPNKITYTWDATKGSWEKCENEKNFEESEENKLQGQYGFDGTYHTYTDPKDNTVYLWDEDKKAWFPKVDDDFIAQYQMNYGFIDNTTKNEDNKREESEKLPSAETLKRKTQEPSWFDVDDEHNTKVYVSNLPLDLTEEEFLAFMQKCGLVMRDINTRKWKIKLYTQKEDNTFKGDALCTYIKKESVDLALSVLDGSELKGNIVKVERAKFQMKGEYNPALKPKKKKKKEKEKEKKIQEKLFEWRPEKLRGEREKHEKTVIVKNLFDPSIFDNHVELILEYTQDLREECSKCGTIKKLVLHDKHPDGVAQVTYSDAEEADLCISLLNNRWFGQRRITAETWDGKTKYKVTEKESEVKQRLEKWNEYLESDNPK